MNIQQQGASMTITVKPATLKKTTRKQKIIYLDKISRSLTYSN